MTTRSPDKQKTKYCFFRCDANRKIGVGHLFRCLTIADALRLREYCCIFVCKEPLDDHLKQKIRGELNELILLNHDALEEDSDASEFISAIQNLTSKNVNLVVVDHYALTDVWESRVKQYCHQLLCIDDLANRRHDCDILLDQTLGRDISDYLDLLPPQTKILCGSRYALLRRNYQEARATAKLKRNQCSTPSNVVVSFGGSAQGQLVLSTLRAMQLNKFARLCQFVVVLSNSDASNSELLSELKRIDLNIRYVSNIDSMLTYWLEADIAIGAAGTSVWERACVGLPAIVTIVAANQQLISKSIENAHAAKVVDLNQDYGENLNKAFTSLFTKTNYQKCIKHSFDVCDGKGVDRLLRLIA